MPDDDSILLRHYADEKSEAAFAELVRRHLDLVYSVALRQVGGNAHLAEEVAQVVFTALARKASELAPRPVLGGWLYRTAQFTAIDVVRAESRRRARETEALHMHDTTTAGGGTADWEKLRPALDRVIGELHEEDRDAVVLRFFEGRSFAEVGARLRLSENTARMRVERALDKLHAALARRGVTSTTVALAGLLSGQAMAAPAGLAATVTGAALAGAVATGANGVGGALVFMSTMKLQVGLTAALVVAGAVGIVRQSSAETALHEEIAALRGQVPGAGVADLRAENQRLTASAAELAALQRDGAEAARLRAAAGAGRTRPQSAMATETDARAKRAAELAKMPVYASDQVEVQPEVKFQARPKVPAALRAAGGHGEARLSYVINADGEMTDVRVLSATHPEWAEAALAAVKQWQFAPARKDGAPVNVRVELPMIYEMEASPAPMTGKQGRRLWF